MVNAASFRLPLLSILLFATAVLLYSRHLDSPYYYHADEPGKTAQVIKDYRNFHHPLLLVNTAASAVAVFHVPLRPQPVVEMGRWVSVFFSALAVALLAAFAWRARGWAAAVATSLILLFQQDVFELAHYFKEDTALLGGTALTFFALQSLMLKPGPLNLIFLSLAVAVAFSSKYVGIVLLAPALFFAWKTMGWKGALACLLIFALCAGILNARMFQDWDATVASFKRETDLVTSGQREISKSIPHLGFVQFFVRKLMPPFGLFFGWGLWLWWRDRSKHLRGGAAETAMVLLPFAFTAMLSFSAKDAGRYFHPALLGICYVAGVGLADLVCRLWQGTLLAGGQRPAGRALAVLCVLLALTEGGWRFGAMWKGFSKDSHVELATFIREKLPASAVVVQGRRVELPDPRGGRDLDPEDFPPLPQDLRTVKWVADAGSLAALRQQGITHVALEEQEYGRYLDEESKPKEDGRKIFEQRRDFYRDLFARGKILFDSPPGKVGNRNPPLRLVELPAL
ncbi:MAG: Dolichyl-phosphate-mannose-protein mannosyltransferase [Verrucomicrobiota bacterium]|jgi:hypothetical protein